MRITGCVDRTSPDFPVITPSCENDVTAVVLYVSVGGNVGLEMNRISLRQRA